MNPVADTANEVNKNLSKYTPAVTFYVPFGDLKGVWHAI